MSKKQTYIILIIAILGVIGLYFYNKYKVAPKINISKLEVLTSDSVKINITSLKGKKVIICFYASWCPNCIEELKILNTIKHSELKNIEIVAITDEGIRKLNQFKTKTNYSFMFLTLTTSFSQININSIPTTYLLNTKGEIVYNKVGYISWEDHSNIEHLKAIME